uniref:Fibronectin type-III domain-containing protein n=1 Tax=Ditylenchus dipsaci TaxID=166011 RepID=A0A915ERK1_9BILA
MIGIACLLIFLVSHLIGCAKKQKSKRQEDQKTIGLNGLSSPKEKQTPMAKSTVSTLAPASLPLIEANNAEKSAGVSCAASSDDELDTALEISDAKLSPKPNSNVQNTPVVVSVVELNSDTAEKYKGSMTVPLVNDDVVGELVDPKKSKYAFPDTPSLIGITNSKIEQSTIKVSSPNHKIYRASSPPFGLSPINSGTKSACSSPGQTKADAVTPKGAEDVLVKTSVREPLVICSEPPSDIRVGSNINDELVVDFRPAVAPIPVQHYIVKYWPVDNPEVEAKTIQVDGKNQTTGIVLHELAVDTEYNFRVDTVLQDGKTLPSEISLIRTPAEEVKCDCSHACRLVRDGDKEVRVECYCPDGYELADDQRTCEQIKEAEKEHTVVQISPTLDDITQQKPVAVDISQDTTETGTPVPYDTTLGASQLPTDQYGNTVTVSTSTADRPPVPTDELGRELPLVYFFNGTALPTDASNNVYNSLGEQIARNEDNQPLGPDSKCSNRTPKPLPTHSTNLKPIYTVANADGLEYKKNAEGMSVDADGQLVPTDSSGQPVGVSGSPLPTDFYGRFLLDRGGTKGPDGGGGDTEDADQALPTDDMGFLIYPVVYPNGELLPTTSSGVYVDPQRGGEEVDRNDQGIPSLGGRGSGSFEPIRPDDSLKATEIQGKPVEQLSGSVDEQLPITTSATPPRQVNVIGPDGQPLPTDTSGRVVDTQGIPYPTNPEGLLFGPDGAPLPTNQQGQQVVVERGPEEQDIYRKTRPRPVVLVIGPDGQPMPTDTSGRIVDKQGSPYPTNYDGLLLGPDGSPLPTNADGQVVVAEGDQEEKTQKAVTLPTDDYGKLVYPIVGSDGQPLPTDQSGRYLDVESGEPIPTDDFGRPLHTEEGQILPKNQQGDYIYSKPSKTPKKVVVIGPDGVPQPTDYQGKWVDAEGRALPTNPEGLLVGPDGSPLPTNAQGQQVVGEGAEGIAKVLPTDASGLPIYPILNSDGQLLPTDATGRYVDVLSGESIPIDESGHPVDKEDGQVLPTNSQGQYIYTKLSVKPIVVIGPDGQPMPTDTSGRVVDKEGSTYPTNPEGLLVGPDGFPIPTNDQGQLLLKEETSPTPIIVIGPDGQPMPTDTSGRVVDKQGSPYPTNYDGLLLGPDGSPLPTNEAGQFVLPRGGDVTNATPVKTLPTDDAGQYIYPIVNSDGMPLPTDSSGRHLDALGEPVPVDDFGHPLDREGGQVLPTDSQGQYIYSPHQPLQDQL